MSRITMITVAAAAALGSPALADSSRESLDQVQPLGEIYFEFDSARVPEGTSVKLGAATAWLRDHPQARIVLDGNADIVGPSPYNVGLALRRASSVQSRLIALGVDPDRILVVTYGEDNLRRTSHALDRRVTVWASDDPLYAIIDSSLVRGTAVVWRRPVEAAQIDGPRVPAVATR